MEECGESLSQVAMTLSASSCQDHPAAQAPALPIHSHGSTHSGSYAARSPLRARNGRLGRVQAVQLGVRPAGWCGTPRARQYTKRQATPAICSLLEAGHKSDAGTVTGKQFCVPHLYDSACAAVPIVCLAIWHWYMLRGDWL